MPGDPRFLFVGNRRKGPSSWTPDPEPAYGISVLERGGPGGALRYLGTVAPELSIGFLCHDPVRGVLYALHEALTLPGRHLGGGGMVAAFRIDPGTGALDEICRVPSYGALPCYASLDSTGRHLAVAHHTGHTPVTRTARGPDGWRIKLVHDEAAIVTFPLEADGSIGPPRDICSFEGSGALPAQSHPQLHCVKRAPGRDFYVVCDKGADRIRILAIEDGRIAQRQEIAAPPGSSPRYAAFHPRLPLFMVDFETAPLLQAYALDPDGLADLAFEQDLSGLAGHDARPMCSDIAFAQEGRVLYTLIRGPEALAVHAVADDGTLAPRGLFPLGVRNPRGLLVVGNSLCVAAVQSRELAVFELGPNGMPLRRASSISLPAPGCIVAA
ncbi:beta-propeller fold lactonase family protein [Mangrovicoccus sp. HB161399]|uniref:lactonase family protein n=1 Tax=Mangrovicoccus sp. HB161399 TaxID=2720392 RepID=UPI00155285D6|nr:beta-propeller fold lactonase family protein [Mangrovicoccus sp. HB161399]